MRKLWVLVLLAEGLEPPESVRGLSDDELEMAPWNTECDVVVTLGELGHDVRILAVHGDLGSLRKEIEGWKPHIAFNLLEEYAGVSLYDQNVVTFLELMHVPCTGCNPKGLIIERDKALSKKLLAYHRIRVPAFAVFPYGKRIRSPKRLQYPIFVKSAVEDASYGISQASLVKDDESLAERVAFVHQQTGADAIAEEFIEGRELYVGVTGNEWLEVLRVWELVFDKKPENAPLIATVAAKWNLKYQKRWGVTSRVAKGPTEEFVRRIERHCKRMYRILGLSGCARLDFRLTPEGRVYFLEANPNPALSCGEDFAESAEKKGISYTHLIHRILSLGLRWKSLQDV